MKKIFLAVMMALPCFAFTQYTYDKLQINFQPANTGQKTLTYANLRLYPIRARDDFKKQFCNVGKYMPLKEAIMKKKVKITEAGDGGAVNNLVIENVSSDTIIVITGEIVKGGKQDRIIDKDLLLKPMSGKVDLPVFCVESGRWSSRTTSSPNDFETDYGAGTVSLRKVVVKDKDQQKVWSKVEEVNTKNKTVTRTGTYTALTNSREFSKRLDGYLSFFGNKLANESDVIGVLVVSGKKVMGCDMFATHELFQQHYGNLLHSYATEAILNGAPVNIAPATVKAYMDQLFSNEKVQAATLQKQGSIFIEKGRKLKVSSFDE